MHSDEKRGIWREDVPTSKYLLIDSNIKSVKFFQRNNKNKTDKLLKQWKFKKDITLMDYAKIKTEIYREYPETDN